MSKKKIEIYSVNESSRFFKTINKIFSFYRFHKIVHLREKNIHGKNAKTNNKFKMNGSRCKAKQRDVECANVKVINTERNIVI